MAIKKFRSKQAQAVWENWHTKWRDKKRSVSISVPDSENTVVDSDTNYGKDENGKLLKGYRYAKGGVIVKVEPK